MTTGPRSRASQRCRTLVLAAALGVVLTFISIVDRTWPGAVVGAIGAVVALVMYRRECSASSGTEPRDS
jgi:membrane associated rhomboid family serine protease